MNLAKALRLPESRSMVQRERRDPKVATQRVGYFSKGLPMPAEWDAESAFRYAYLSNIVVYRCVQIISETLASCPFRVGKDADRPMDYNPDAPLAQLLSPPPLGPNPEMAAFDLIANGVAQFLVSGRMGWEIELGDDNETPIALWPLAAQHLRAIPSERGNKYFAGFEYGQPGDAKKLKEDQVFYHWKPALTDIRQPESALQAARLDISVAVMQDRYDYAFLNNNATPAAIMVVNEFETREEFIAFKEQINSEYGGPSNAGRTLIAEATADEEGEFKNKSIEVEQLGLSQKDAEFIKRHEQKFRNIAIALGVQWSKMDASGRTYDNAESEEKSFWQNTMIPHMVRLQNRINIKLAPRLGSEIGWFDTSHIEVLKPNKKFTQVSAKDAVGVFASLDEVRDDAGLAPAEDDVKADLLKASVVEEAEEVVKAEPARVKVEFTAPEPIDKRALADHVKETIQVPISREVRRTKILKKVDKQAQLREKRWQQKFRKLFARQEKAVLDRLEGKRGRQALQRGKDEPVTAMFDPDFWLNETRELAEELYGDLYELGAQRILDTFMRQKRDVFESIDYDFGIDSAGARAFVEARALRLAGQVTDTTYDAIKEALSEGIAEGEGIPKLAARIKEVFAEANSSRAEMIARTEVLRGYNESANDVAKSLPNDVVGGKEWIGEGSNDVCTELNGRLALIGETFEGYDTPPAHPRCRCTVAFLTPEEMQAAGYAPRSAIPLKDVQKVLTRIALEGAAA